jgi:hypothetical protein
MASTAPVKEANIKKKDESRANIKWLSLQIDLYIS